MAFNKSRWVTIVMGLCLYNGSARAQQAAGAPAAGLIAVLEIRTKLTDGALLANRGYLADVVRVKLLDLYPAARIITRENMFELLRAFDAKPEECEGECEVETGRKLHASFVVTGELVSVSNNLVLSLKLHETAGGRLLAGAQPTGRSLADLEGALEPAIAKLLGAIVPTGAVRLVPLKPVPKPTQLSAGEVSLDADPDALVAYDKSIQLDAKGEKEPIAAADAWAALATIKNKNPYLEQARNRSQEWREYGRKKKETEDQIAEDRARMTKLLPLATLSEDQKAKLFVAFAGRYGPPAALAYLSHVPSAQAQAVCRKLLQMNLGVTTDIEAMDTAGASLAADVNVDGMTVGRTPLRVYLPPCAIALEVRSEGLLWKRGLALSPSSPDQKMVAVLPKGYRRDKGFVRDEIHRMEWTGRPSMRVNWLAADRLCLGGKNEDTFRLPTAEEALSLPVVVLEQLLEMDPAVPVWTSSSAGVGSGYYVVKEMTQERIEMSRSQPQGVLCVRNQVN